MLAFEIIASLGENEGVERAHCLQISCPYLSDETTFEYDFGTCKSGALSHGRFCMQIRTVKI